jgi:hypothetical protein
VFGGLPSGLGATAPLGPDDGLDPASGLGIAVADGRRTLIGGGLPGPTPENGLAPIGPAPGPGFAPADLIGPCAMVLFLNNACLAAVSFGCHDPTAGPLGPEGPPAGGPEAAPPAPPGLAPAAP